MKAQMRFQKYICLAMIIVGAIGLIYAFCYCTGSISELGQAIIPIGSNRVSAFTARKGMNDATLFTKIKSFNDILMYCGIVMVLLAVLLYITACHKRRNYYVTNYVAIGLCAGGNIVMSLVLMILNAHWKSEFLNVDFEAWLNAYAGMPEWSVHYSDSTTWFDIGFGVYILIILASLVLILNLIWKIMLMKGEKKLLAGNQFAGGEAV